MPEPHAIDDIEIPPHIVERIKASPFQWVAANWRVIEEEFGMAGRRALCRIDRFYLLVVVLGRADALHPWLYERCREVEANMDGYLDLWAREHYKSTIITFAGIIQEIILKPEITIGIFSHTKHVSRKFLAQIKRELEGNETLIQTFPDIFYEAPRRESPRWSEDKGLVVKRKANPKEGTVEAHGLVDGMPTGAHFELRVYDDVVTKESVSTPDQIAKVTEAWELSDNLGARQEDGRSGRAWHIGTRYSFADTYHVILERKALIPRIHPATTDGTPDGELVFLSPEAWDEKKRKQGPATIACQMLQNPAAGTEAMFNKDHLRFAEVRPATLNIYILCDPASSKKKGSDKTAMPVIGVDAAGNKWLLDGFHHKMNLQERWTNLYNLRRHWTNQPGVQGVFVGYERYGMRSDIEYFEEKMVDKGVSFHIEELAWPNDGPGSKFDRIQRLYPDFSEGKFFLPRITKGKDETAVQKKIRAEGQPFRIYKPTRRRDHEGNIYNLNRNFIEEYLTYPFSVHDDFLDAASRIYDMDPQAPRLIDEGMLEPETWADGA